MTEKAPLPDRICPRHETTFTPRHPNQVFCSPECKIAAHKEEKELGRILIEAGLITRAQLRALHEALGALGNTEALIGLIRAQGPYTDPTASNEGDRT